MKRMTYFVMVLALVLGFTQCKKEQLNDQNEAEVVHITLNVENSGSRHQVVPGESTAAVNYEENDVIYVGDGSTYIGTLTCGSDGKFSGTVNTPTGNKLYFYFVGGLPSGDLTQGSTTSFNVDISDQTSKLPVLSYASVDYTGAGAYSCKLKNKCALVKYTFTNESRTVRVGGRYTQATINFANGAADDPANVAITPVATTGFITLKSESETEKYGIFLPQATVEGTDAQMIMGYEGYTLNVPAIGLNDYKTINGDAAVTNNIVYLDYLTGNYTATNGKILTGTLNGETQPYKINVNTNGATVTLRNATISGYDESTVPWAGITCENNTTLVIEGTNSVTGFYNDYPGIHIASDKTLTIQGTTGTLNVSSNGYGAGIGGGPEIPCGNIVIESGTINATGGMYEAGIGGGYCANCGSITINGGNVTATGGKGAAGIGTGLSQVNITGGGISIMGGTVVATGGIGAAGIGSGFAAYGGSGLTNKCGNISITGGQVTATGGNGGSSAYNDLGVTNSAYYGGAGIGTGSTNRNNSKSSCGNITIGSGVTRVTATKGGGTNPATNSIGKNHSSNPGTCGTVTIEDPSKVTQN